MKVKVVKSEGLAHNSYYLTSGDEAAVIDPRRDCTIYTQLAAQDCAKIKYILETHRNEDYVIGSLELQNMTEAEIAHSKELPFKYGEHNLVGWRHPQRWQHKNQNRLHAGAHKRIAKLHHL